MAAGRHIYEVYIKAAPDRVWQAIVDPDFMRQYFHNTWYESPLVAGESGTLFLGAHQIKIVAASFTRTFARWFPRRAG